MGKSVVGSEQLPHGPASIGRHVATLNAMAAYVDELDHGVLLLDRTKHVAFCSARACHLLGMSRDPVGLSLRDLLSTSGPTAEIQGGLLGGRLRALLRRGGSVVLRSVGESGSVACMVGRSGNGGWSVQVRAGDQSGGRCGAAAGTVDRVTGLPDREAFRAALREAVRDSGRNFAVVAVALDRFRQVNDTLGHGTGDGVLRMVAGRLRTTLRRGDLLARSAGAAFAIVVDGVQEADDAEALARRIVDLLGRAFVIDGHVVNIDASAGVALSPAHGVDAEVLSKRADLALGRAKRDGGASARLFDAGMDASSLARRSLEIDLRRALALNQFELAYQPQMELSSGRLSGCEALIRWCHPARGLVSPAEFIPLAEEIGLIGRIGEWVLRAACREAARWSEEITVAVNLSPAQFRDAGLVGTVASALADAGLPPDRLELEITEGLLLRESEGNLVTLAALRGLGIRIAIDDFGTGYASLSALRAFPFDRIKIDRSFISGEKAGHKSRAIVRAIAELGATFGMTTVAEGVETPDQLRQVRLEGVTTVQGYLIGRPMPGAEIALAIAGRAPNGCRPEHVNAEPCA